MKNTISMVAYAQYFNDARVKGYVDSLINNGYSVHIFCLYDDFSFSLNNSKLKIKFLGKKYMGNSKKLYLLSYLTFFIKAFLYLGFYEIRYRYSVVHVHNQPDFLVFSALIPKLFGSKIILDLHDIMMSGVMIKFNSTQEGTLFKLVKLQTALSVKFCDVLFCADHSQHEFLLSNGISKNEFYVFLNLPNEKFFKPNSKKFSNSNELKIINHGTLSHRLGIDILIRAVERASKQVNVSLTLIGDGEQKEELIDYCKRQNLIDKIIFFKDFIPVENLQSELEKYDLGIISMRYNPVYERCMLPVKLLEYAFIGIPVITSDLYGIRKYFSEDMVEYVQPENLDQLVNKIILLYKDKKRREVLVSNASKFFEKFNWKTQEQNYLKIISS